MQLKSKRRNSVSYKKFIKYVIKIKLNTKTSPTIAVKAHTRSEVNGTYDKSYIYILSVCLFDSYVKNGLARSKWVFLDNYNLK